MSCRLRFKQTRFAAFYHVYSRIAGSPADRPLQQPNCRRKLLALIQHYTRAYCCEVAAFALMGNHYHLILRFDPKSQLPPAELARRAHLLYPGPHSQEIIANWSPAQWQRFNDRLFDLSELLRNLQARFAKWYNQTFERRGRFWATRFKSVFLKDLRAVRDCMLYVDLNPVRAGQAAHPADYEFCSHHQRTQNRHAAAWLLPPPSTLRPAHHRAPSPQRLHPPPHLPRQPRTLRRRFPSQAPPNPRRHPRKRTLPGFRPPRPLPATVQTLHRRPGHRLRNLHPPATPNLPTNRPIPPPHQPHPPPHRPLRPQSRPQLLISRNIRNL